MMKREIIPAYVSGFPMERIVDDGYTPDDVIEQMRQLKSAYEGRDIYFDFDYYGHDGGVSISLWEQRLETDAEYAARVKKEEKEELARKTAKLKQEEKERKEYLRLKKKFG
jgi:hypothetical protein